MEQINQSVETLTNIYIKSQYSTEALDDNDREKTLAIWQKIRKQLVLAHGLFWLKKLKLNP